MKGGGLSSACSYTAHDMQLSLNIKQQVARQAKWSMQRIVGQCLSTLQHRHLMKHYYCMTPVHTCIPFNSSGANTASSVACNREESCNITYSSAYNTAEAYA